MLRRSGLTLIELLVAIAVMSVLIGLTAGAVQRVRSTAARVRCLDNLRQLGLAAHNHQSALNHFPTGVTSVRDPREPYPYLTWMVRLLPYLEQDAIWADTIRAFKTNPDFQAEIHTHRGRALAVFSCPADSRAASPAVFPLSTGGSKAYGLTSYLGVEGRNNIKRDGLLHFDAAYRPADVTDGLSNTLFIGERPPSSDLHFGWWYAGIGMRQDGCADSVLGVRAWCMKEVDCGTCPDDPSNFRPGRFDNKCDMLHFWSPHPGGAHFAFADGSVRFLRYSADPILPALATRAGGEAVTIPD